MGLFGIRKTRKTRSSSVGVADEDKKTNDCGSFSGLEVAIDRNGKNSKTKVEEKINNKPRYSWGDKGNSSGTKNENNKKTGAPKGTPKAHRKPGFLFRSRNGGSRRRGGKTNPPLADAAASILSGYPAKQRQQQQQLTLKNYSGDESLLSKDLSVYTSSANPTKNHPNHRPASLDGFVTLDHLSDLILDLDTAVVVGAKRSIRALKMLLALSSSTSEQKQSTNKNGVAAAAATALEPPTESEAGILPSTTWKYPQSIHDIRIEMTRAENGRLVPVLLSFLKRCMVHSKEHTLTMLLLGNISIPQENKKVSVCSCVSLLRQNMFSTLTDVNFVFLPPIPFLAYVFCR